MAAATIHGEGPPSATGQMTEAEALMWNVETDPWFSSTIGTLIICDRPLHVPHFTRKVAAAVADLPRLRARVVPRAGGLAPPSWRTDAAFELGYHVRHLSLPQPGDRRQLLELSTRLLQDPFDRTRPLWQFVVVDGLEDGQGALVVKLHHAVTDGAGGVQLAARYLDQERDASPPPDVDLDKLIAGIAASEGRQDGDGGIAALGGLAAHTAGQAARWQLGVVRKLAGDAGIACADPARMPELAGEVGAAVRTLVTQLSPGGANTRSPLWAERSRKRHLEVLDLPFGPVKQAAKRLGGTINDFFVSGAVAGAARYHEAENTPLDRLTITFVVSTRGEPGEGGNAFTPSKVVVPASPANPSERFRTVRDVLAARRREVRGSGLLAGLASVANLLPTSLVTRLARSQAAGVDFATSNVRAAPFEVYAAGAKVLASYPIGPVAGTAWNVTLLSYAGRLHLGVHIDPVAVGNVPLLIASLADAYDELLHAAP